MCTVQVRGCAGLPLHAAAAGGKGLKACRRSRCPKRVPIARICNPTQFRTPSAVGAAPRALAPEPPTTAAVTTRQSRLQLSESNQEAAAIHARCAGEAAGSPAFRSATPAAAAGAPDPLQPLWASH